MDLKLSELLEQLRRCGNENICHESALRGNYDICSYLFCRLFYFFVVVAWEAPQVSEASRARGGVI